MNSFLQGKGEAVIHFGPSDYTIMEGGAYVTCATTGDKIPLEMLRYWNEDRQGLLVRRNKLKLLLKRKLKVMLVRFLA